MQKTILAVALASAFSMGTACSADTNVKTLQGQGIDPLLEGKYQLGGDYTLDGMTESIAYKANIDLNGHTPPTAASRMTKAPRAAIMRSRTLPSMARVILRSR